MANSYPGSGTVVLDDLKVCTNVRLQPAFISTGEHMFLTLESAHSNTYLPVVTFARAGCTLGIIGLERASNSDSLGNYAESEMLIGTRANTPTSIQTNGVRRLNISTDGRIGIGSCNYTLGGFNAKMLIKQTSNGDWTGLQVADATDEHVINFGYNGTDFLISQSWRLCGPTKNLKIGQGCQLFLKTDGNVGIGTETPATKLQIRGVNQYHQISACFFSTYNSGFAFSDNLAGMTYDAGSNSFCLYSDYTGYGKVVISTCGAPRLTVNVGGNVGIGCSTPRNTLEIVGVTSSPALCATNCDLMKIAGNTNSSLSIGSTVVSPYPMWIQVKHQSVDNLTYPLSLQTCGGNVGIGILNPGSYKLYVNGSFYSAGSSCEYKTQICQYNTDSCMFMKLTPVAYQYKDEYCHLGKELKSGTQIGLIAEDVAEVYPELAILKDEEDEKVVRNVDYEKLSIILLSELQKLRAEVDELKSK